MVTEEIILKALVGNKSSRELVTVLMGEEPSSVDKMLILRGLKALKRKGLVTHFKRKGVNHFYTTDTSAFRVSSCGGGWHLRVYSHEVVAYHETKQNTYTLNAEGGCFTGLPTPPPYVVKQAGYMYKMACQAIENPKTALVLKPIPRNEWGTDAEGFMATTGDRVVVVRSRRFSCGSRQYECRTEKGEAFVANDNMVRVDS